MATGVTLRAGLAIILSLIGTSSVGQAATRWTCSHQSGAATVVEERGSTLLLFWGDREGQPDRWAISISNEAALIAAKPVTEWSRASRSTYPSKEAVMADVHPIGAALNILSIDKLSGLFQLAMMDTHGGLARQEQGQCSAVESPVK